jgi:transcriptional regulator with XRE-family HTH domain
MSPLLHIRKNVLGVTQVEMAAIAGVRQATVSRWETDRLQPGHEQMAAIRAEAIRRGVAWDDALFFAAPAGAAA